MKSETTTVDSLGKLVDEVARLSESFDDGLLWFRGHKDASWNVVPSVWRHGDKKKEVSIAHQFRAWAQHRMQSHPPYDAWAEWLSTMQHYGLPTRLLDWSTSPLVATYFALEYLLDDPTKKPTDAAIWVLRPALLNKSEGYEAETRSAF